MRGDDDAPEAVSFRDAVLDGLSRPHKAIPCKFLYDQAGSALFERISALPEYYPTRTEIGILTARAAEIAARIGPACRLIEFGSGASRKARILLDALDAPAAYIPVDIAREPLLRNAAEMAAEHPGLDVAPIWADYTRAFPLPPSPATGGRTVAFFPGSTIGNFERDEAVAFLSATARLTGPGGLMLLGVDLKKDPAILHAAYNDAEGVTAAFNRNLLVRANRELDGDFDPGAFAHYAFYEPRRGRIEMNLVSLRPQSARVAGRTFSFESGEAIHTENSCKYTLAEARKMALAAGFVPIAAWVDPDALFSVHLLEAR